MNRGVTQALQNEFGKCNEIWRIISDAQRERRKLAVAGGMSILRQGKQSGDLRWMQEED